jgi:hypothetical protein
LKEYWGKCFGGRRPSGKPRYTWKGEVRMNTVKLLNRENWRAAGRYERLEGDMSDWREIWVTGGRYE